MEYLNTTEKVHHSKLSLNTTNYLKISKNTTEKYSIPSAFGRFAKEKKIRKKMWQFHQNGYTQWEQTYSE